MSEPGRGTPEVSRITMARLAEIDPDHLFVYGDLRNWKADPAFMRLWAFQAGRIAEVDRNLWSRGRGPIAAGLILDQAVAVLADGETAMPRPASPPPR